MSDAPHLPRGCSAPDDPSGWRKDRWVENAKTAAPASILGARTCTYCGGLHPEETLRLVREEKWEVEATDKNYKLYLHPPGYRIAHAAVMRHYQSDGAEAYPTYVWLSPPAKLYLNHFSDTEWALLCAVARGMDAVS